MKRVLVVGYFSSGSGLTQVIFNVFSRFDPIKYKIDAVGYGTDPENLTDKKCEKLGWQFERVIPVTKTQLNTGNGGKPSLKSIITTLFTLIIRLLGTIFP